MRSSIILHSNIINFPLNKTECIEFAVLLIHEMTISEFFCCHLSNTVLMSRCLTFNFISSFIFSDRIYKGHFSHKTNILFHN